ncbi:MAG TPA: EAL domain-containing protein [Thermoanaerobaculia bacterium]|nr:EAL domain-containing protein [Thermoanaerobaculia bacterium]
MTRWPLRLVAAVLLAVLLPPALLVWLSFRLESRALRDDLERRARSAAALTDALLAGAESLLTRLGSRWDGSCAPETAEALRAALELGSGVRGVALLDAELHPACSAGTAPAPLPPSVRTALEGDARAVWEGGAPGDLLRLALRLPFGAAEASLDAGPIARALSELAGGGRDAVEVRGVAGPVLALPGSREPRRLALPLRLLGPLVGARDETAAAPCAGGGASVLLRASREAQLAAWGATLPLLVAIGLGFGAGAAALVLLAGSPGAALTRQLRGAIRRGELEVRYLPIVEVTSGRCVGAEALLRWRHAREGLLSPDLFIALAEETGLIVPITEWLMRRVARDLPDGLREPDRFYVAINLAGAHLRDPGTVAAVLRAFAGSRLGPKSLVFEVTERELIDDANGTARNVLEALQGWGATIALDDFGTGYSNIATLRRFRLDHLKIDKSFVEGIGTGSVAETVVDTLVELGRKLEMTVVAEGVEREEQVDYLVERGVRHFQGFLYAKPLPLKELVAFVEGRGGGPPVS